MTLKDSFIPKINATLQSGNVEDTSNCCSSVLETPSSLSQTKNEMPLILFQLEKAKRSPAGEPVHNITAENFYRTSFENYIHPCEFTFLKGYLLT